MFQQFQYHQVHSFSAADTAHAGFTHLTYLPICSSLIPVPLRLVSGITLSIPATMGTPSPWGSRPVGDPTFAQTRRLVRLGAPFFSFLPSLPDTHRRELSASLTRSGLFPEKRRVIAVSPRERCCGGHFLLPLESRVQPIQASPLSCAQDLRHLTRHPFVFRRFPAMLLSLSPFGSR